MAKKFFLKSFRDVLTSQLDNRQENKDQERNESRTDEYIEQAITASLDPFKQQALPGESVIEPWHPRVPYRDLNINNRMPEVKQGSPKKRKASPKAPMIPKQRTSSIKSSMDFIEETIIIEPSPESSPKKLKISVPTPNRKVLNKIPVIKIEESSSDNSPVKYVSIKDESSTENSPVKNMQYCLVTTPTTFQENVVKKLSFCSNNVDKSDTDSVESTFCTNDTEFYFQGDGQLPIFSKTNTSIKTMEGVGILLGEVSEDKIATKVPFDISENVSFIMNSKKIGHWRNALSDCMGSWESMCTKKIPFQETTDGYMRCKNGICSLSAIRHNYRNKSSPDLHRVIIRIVYSSNETLFCDNVYVQYYFEKQEHKVHVKSHGNALNIDQPYVRTMHSTLNKIKTKIGKETPKQIFNNILDEAGGIDNIQSSSQKARDRQQIYNQQRKDVLDPVLEVMDMAKLDPFFIRSVETTPEFKIFLSTDDQLDEIEKFCTFNNNFSVLGVDTTFNIGNYFVTLTTYRHLMLMNKKKKHEPVMLGPALIHKKKTFESYFTLPSGMMQHRKGLSKILVYGSDGDQNLSNTFETCFPLAEHLLCDLHMKDNIKNKLSSLNISGGVAKQYSKEIFGTNCEDTKIPGLVDCESSSDFDKKLENLKTNWLSRHANGLSFYNYFMEYKAPLIKNCMSATLRSKCGLGFPPKPYTQNANESANSMVKYDLGHKKKSVPEFITAFRKIIHRQKEAIKLALIGQGEIVLKDEYKHLGVEENKYYRMTPAQKEAVHKKLLKFALFPKHQDHTQNLRAESDLDTTQICEDLANSLSVKVARCQVLSVPFTIMEGIFTKAARLVRSSNDIVKAPGSSSGLSERWVVSSTSNPNTPHVIHQFPSGQLSCDKSCQRWDAFKICSHVIAVAERENILQKFLDWFNKTNKTSYTNLSNRDMPSNSGKKATKSTSVRKGPSNKVPQEPLCYADSCENSNLPAISSPKPQDGAYMLHMLKFCDSKVSVCYGCKGRLKINGNNPPPPADLVVITKTRRKYYKDGVEKIGTLSNVYFHLNENCIKLINSYFVSSLIYVSPELKQHLLPEHKQLLTAANIVL